MAKNMIISSLRWLLLDKGLSFIRLLYSKGPRIGYRGIGAFEVGNRGTVPRFCTVLQHQQ